MMRNPALYSQFYDKVFTEDPCDICVIGNPVNGGPLDNNTRISVWVYFLDLNPRLNNNVHEFTNADFQTAACSSSMKF